MKNLKELPHTSGIYMVNNLINGHKYIGQAKDIYKRFNSHHIHDYKNPSCSCYNGKFYQALRKYGLDNFEILILEFCPIEELDEKEVTYIEKYNTFHNGYNSTAGGQNWTPNIHSPETEEKRRITREKNKSLKSENHPRARLSNEEVLFIRQRYINGETTAEIHKDYKDKYPSEAVFRRIIFGMSYKDVGNIPEKSQIRHTNGKLTDVQIREIKAMYAKEKISFAAIGRKYGLTGGAISAIIHGKTYKHVD